MFKTKYTLVSDNSIQLFPPIFTPAYATAENKKSETDKQAYLEKKKEEVAIYAFKLFYQMHGKEYKTYSVATLPKSMDDVFKKLS